MMSGGRCAMSFKRACGSILSAYFALCAAGCAVGQGETSTPDATQQWAEMLYEEPQPLPEYVGPEPIPGTTVPAAEANRICVGLELEPLLRPGDFWDWFENDISLRLDGELLTQEPSHQTLDSLAGITDDQGNTVALSPYADIICWETALSAGTHVAEAVIWTSDGEETEFVWAFKVTD
jgi:hypothetical protein